MTKLKARITGLLLCLALLLSFIPAQAAAEKDTYVSREQAVVSLLDAIGLEALNETEADLSVFNDADLISTDYVDELGIAVSNGILSGTTGKRLNPQSNITRLEFAMVLSHAMRELPVIRPSIIFTDVPFVAAGDVSKIVKAGLMSGYGNGLFGSDDYLTQQQLAIILNKIEGLSEIRYQDDFYYAVNYQWLTNTKLPAGYAGLMAFDEVDMSNTAKMKAMVQDLVSKQASFADGTKEQKIVDFYSTILDKENRNKEGISPIKGFLDRIDGAKTAQELLTIVAQIEAETGINTLFSFGPSEDLMDSTRYSLYGSGLSIGLPAEYILMDNPQFKALYEGLLTQLYAASGLSAEAAYEKAQSFFALERVIAGAVYSSEQASKIENLYNPMTVDELAALFSKVDIKKYLTELGYGSVESLIITDPGCMKKTGELLADENLDGLKDYCRIHMMINTASLLSDDVANVIQAFSMTFSGISSAMSDEDVAFNLLGSVMSSYLGKMYVERYFSEDAKKDVESIVADIIAAYEKRIEKLDWMSADTKTAAIGKLKAIKVKIGYPDTWPDPLAGITIKTYAEGGSLLNNAFAIASAQNKQAKTLLSKPVDKSQWGMSPQTVNAYYSPSNNEIVFPAGILQPPFYDYDAPREQNLGGIGAIIAHEITHAFDNNGAQFDADGNMKNWWTESDYAAFQQKCMEVVNLYHGLEIAPNAYVNGVLTLSENVADIGAMAAILDVAENIPNVDYKKLFEANATIWRYTCTNQMYQLLATQDVHAPNKFRVNRVLVNFQEFYDTYDIKPGDALYLAPEDRVTVW
jgi:putative endopeptidase